jgi:hypothetical protein
MWTANFTAETSATSTDVWDALQSLHSGIALGPASDKFELHGPFAVGTEVTVTPQGQDAMKSIITELEPGCVYADQTSFGELLLTFRHQLQTTQAGGTVVTHTLEITGPGSDQVGPELGPQISGDFPIAMAELIASAERGLRV